MIINLAKIIFKKGIIKTSSYEQQLLILLSVFIKKRNKKKQAKKTQKHMKSNSTKIDYC